MNITDSLCAYLKSTNPGWVKTSKPYDFDSFNRARRRLWEEHKRQVEEREHSVHENYLDSRSFDFIPLHLLARMLPIGSLADLDGLTPVELLSVYRETLKNLDCLFFDVGKETETVYAHKARLICGYRERQQAEMAKQLREMRKGTR